MMRLYRVLGKHGRITIPFEIRKRIGFGYNDILSFTVRDEDTVIIRKEKVCDDCEEFEVICQEDFSIEDFLDSLSEEEQKEALVHLSVLWAERKK
jgi:AbrB family looped-hinge helix DNA binding protein